MSLRPGAETWDPAVREAARQAITRWQQLLRESGLHAATAAIRSETGALVQLARSHETPALAERLQGLAMLVDKAPAFVETMLQEIATLAGLPPREAAAAAPVPVRRPGAADHASGGTLLAVQRPSAGTPSPTTGTPAPAAAKTVVMEALPASPAPSPPAAAMRPPLGATNLSAIEPPPLSEVAPPSLLDAAAPAAGGASGARTMLISQQPAIAPAALGRATPSDVPAPPPLKRTFFGFRAFGAKGSDHAPAAPSPGAGLLGLRKIGGGATAQVHARPREGPGRRPLHPQTDSAEAPRRAPGAPAPRGPNVPWWLYVVGGTVVVLAAATAVVIARSASSGSAGIGRPSARLAPTPSSSPTPRAASATSAKADDAQLQEVTRLVHERGPETKELRALLDVQAHLALKCKQDPSTCGHDGWTANAREALSATDASPLVLTPLSEAPLPAWLRSLKLPSGLSIRDEPALKNPFDFNTKNIAGRASFQDKLWECSAYADVFDATFIKYGVPRWMTAVVFQESGCNPLATSPVGARGLWQFMPESARAYGLRVVEGEIDERLNPIKSTDAAMHFFTDLYRKLGSWDLVLAAYNLGPFGVIARVARIRMEGNVGFWELAHAGVLPDETAGYVPAIEAFAIVLENLARLQFNATGKRREGTAELIVKPGMRLSLLARAASTTEVHIAKLNPEFLRDVVPDGQTTALVPDAQVHDAQAFLDSWSPADRCDTCVPPDFDWGSQQFERSKFAKCCGEGAGRRPAP